MPKKHHRPSWNAKIVTWPLLAAGFLSLLVAVPGAWASISSYEVIALANSARAAAGLEPLTENSMLSAAAQHKAEDMFTNDYFAHTSPQGVTPWFWIKEAGYEYQAAGENLAIHYDNAQEQHQAWMKSASHRANILNPHYREIGVATVQGTIDGQAASVVTVEFFGTPLHAAAQPLSAPPAEQSPSAIPGTEVLVEASPALLSAGPSRSLVWRDGSVLVLFVVVGLAIMAPAALFVFLGYGFIRQALRTCTQRTLVRGCQALQSHPRLVEYHLRL